MQQPDVVWAVASRQSTRALPLQALDQSLQWAATHRYTYEIVHHFDHGSQYTSQVYSTHLNEAGIVASTGTVGDSYDNAMAETLNGAYKTEFIHPRALSVMSVS